MKKKLVYLLLISASYTAHAAVNNDLSTPPRRIARTEPPRIESANGTTIRNFGDFGFVRLDFGALQPAAPAGQNPAGSPPGGE
jgi:hypothetical protein